MINEGEPLAHEEVREEVHEENLSHVSGGFYKMLPQGYPRQLANKFDRKPTNNLGIKQGHVRGMIEKFEGGAKNF